MTERVFGAAALAAIYLLLLPQPALLDVPIALAVGTAAVAAIGASPLGPAPAHRPGLAARVVALPALAAWVVADVARGTVRVALAVLGVRPPRAPGEVRVDVAPCSEQSLVVAGVLVTLSPGSVLVACDPASGSLCVHVLDADDPESVRASVARLHELVRRVVGA